MPPPACTSTSSSRLEPKTKTRSGARVTKRYHPPVAPLDRALIHAAVDATAEATLRERRARADPVVRRAEIRAAQAELGERVDRRGTEPAQPQSAAAAICPRRNLPPPQSAIVDLDHFAASLETTRRDGERRAPHRRPYRRRKPVPRRPCMLDDVQDRIRAWLDREPTVGAIEVPSRLGSAQPERFSDKHLRTVQRAVKVWRSQQARRIILAGSFRRATPA